jgi:hypothetical protein
MADLALESRNKLLLHFAAANATSTTLSDALARRLDRKTTVAMISAMLGALGAKGDKELLGGMTELIEGDDLARASKFWKPLEAVPVTLSMACRKLIATSKFVPKPVELAEACREAMTELRSAERYCDELIGYVRRCDALLLEFAPEQWRVPYLTPEYAPIVYQMLGEHGIYGNGDPDFMDFPPEDDEPPEKEHNRAFREALDRARLEFPEPDEIEQQPEQTKLAACAQAPAKKTHKPKGGKSKA